MAISIVRDAFFDPFSTLAVQGIDDIINAYNPYTFSDRNERNERNYNRLTQEMESGDILLVYTFNQPF